MSIRVVWLVSWLPLRNSLRRLFYQDRGGAGQHLRPVAATAAALYLAFELASPFLIASPVASLLRLNSVSVAGLWALVWAAWIAASGAVGCFGVLALQQEEFRSTGEALQALPVRFLELAAARVLSLVIEGAAWSVILWFPLLGLCGILAGATWLQWTGTAALAMVVSAGAVGCGICMGNLLFGLARTGGEGRLLGTLVTSAVALAGIGLTAMAGSGRSLGDLFSFAEMLASRPWSPVHIPQTITMMLLSGDGLRAAPLALFVALASAALLGLATFSSSRRDYAG